MKEKERERTKLFGLSRAGGMILAFLMACMGFGLSVGAETDFYALNNRKYVEVTGELNELSQIYTDLDESGSNSVAKAANAVIGEYTRQMLELRDSEEAEMTDLTDSFELLRRRALLSGKLTWIANFHTKASPSKEIKDKLSELRAKTDACTDISELDESAELAQALCIEMNREVFYRLLLQERQAGDSAITENILKRGIDALNKCAYGGIDGAEQLLIYEDTVRAASLQRVRDGAADELLYLYTQINGSGEGFHKSFAVNAFFAAVDGDGQVDESLTVSDINRALYDAVCALMGGSEGGRYELEYKASLLLALDKAVEQGNQSGACASFSELFAGYPSELIRARTKDAVAALKGSAETNSDLLALIAEYNSSGGILDRCSDTEQMAAEYARAERRVALCRAYYACRQGIEELLQMVNAEAAEALCQRAKTEIYAPIDAHLRVGDTAELDGLLAYGEEGFSGVINEARAEKFKTEYADILNAGTVDGSMRDRLLAAINAFAELSLGDSDVSALLENEKRVLNEKYKALTLQALRAEMPYGEVTDFESRITAISDSGAPDATVKACDGELMRARCYAQILEKYSQISLREDWSSFDEGSRAALLSTLGSAKESILSSSAEDNARLFEILDGIKASALLDLARHTAIAELRLFAKLYAIDTVSAVLADAETRAAAASSESEINEIRAEALFSMKRCAAAFEIRSEIIRLESEISELRALSQSAKEALCAECEAKAQFEELAMGALDEAALLEISEELERQISALRVRAQSEALAEGKRQSLEKIKSAADGARALIEALEYVNYENSETAEGFLAELDGIARSFESDIFGELVGWDRLDALEEAARKSIREISDGAQRAQISGARAYFSDEIRAFEAEAYKYAEAEKSALAKIISDTLAQIEKIEKTDSTEELLALFAKAKADIGALVTLLDTAKAEARELMESAYAGLEALSAQYSQSVWAEIREIYTHTLSEIEQVSDHSALDKPRALAEERIALMRQKRMNTVYSDKSNGLQASLSLTDGVPFDATLTVSSASTSEAQSRIWQAVKEKRVLLSGGGYAERSLLKRLRRCSVPLGMNLEYSYSQNENGEYTVSVLLPDGISTEGLLGIACADGDGNIRLLEYSLSGRELTFSASSLSGFYLVSERVQNLWALIAVLSALLAAELAAIAYILFKRYGEQFKGKRKTEKMTKCASAVPIFALAKVLPKGGAAISVILGAFVVLAGGALAYLLLEARLKRDGAFVYKKRENARERVFEPSESTENETEREENTKRGENTVREESTKSEEQCREALMQTAAVTVRGARENNLLSTVSVYQADEMMSDEEAKAALGSEVSDGEGARCGKKYEVNIDTISALFEPDETVSVQSLKDKGILPARARFVKILARGSLDKPLTVIAQDFSTAAVKMITLTGGKAVIVE